MYIFMDLPRLTKECDAYTKINFKFWVLLNSGEKHLQKKDKYLLFILLFKNKLNPLRF